MDEQDKQDIVDRLEAVGRPDLAERYKHLSGKHDQRTHGWRYAKGGSDADRLSAARRSMRGTSAEQRDQYRKRAGMQQIRPAKSDPTRKNGTAEEVAQIDTLLQPKRVGYYRPGDKESMGPSLEWYRDVVRGASLDDLYEEYIGLVKRNLAHQEVADRARDAVEAALKVGRFINV